MRIIKKRTFSGLCMVILLMSTVVCCRVYSEDEIIVTATRTAKNIHDVPASVDVMDRAEIESANAVSVDELFKTIAGVDLQGSGYPGSAIKLNLRGLTPGYQSKRVLVLVDGRRVNDQYQGNAEFALLPADGIERIEILKGPASALYGSGAMGGVINIVTRRGDVKGGRMEISSAVGENNTRHYKLNYGGQLGVWDYLLTGSHVETDGYIDNSDGTDRDWLARNITANIGLAIDENKEIRLFLGQYAGEGTDEDSERETRKNYEAVAYTWQWHEESQAILKARLYRSTENHEYDWKYPGEGIYEQYTVAGELEQSLWLGDINLVTFGLEARRESVDIDEVQGPIDEHASVSSLYAQDEIHVMEAVRITVGLRDDYNRDYGDEFSPRLGVLWNVSQDMELFASVNRAHRAPGLSDRFVNVVYWGMRFEGNPDLEPESMTAYETGIRKRFGERLGAELSVFDNHMKDSFDFMMESDGIFRIRNATRVRTYGFETVFRLKITDTLSGFANYSLTKGSYDEFLADPRIEGNELAYLAKDKANIGLKYRKKGMMHSLSCRYVDSRYGDAGNTSENRLNEYVTVDWRSRIKVAENAWISLNVDNIFDKEYQDFPGLDQPGRRVLGGLELVF